MTAAFASPKIDNDSNWTRDLPSPRYETPMVIIVWSLLLHRHNRQDREKTRENVYGLRGPQAITLECFILQARDPRGSDSKGRRQSRAEIALPTDMVRSSNRAASLVARVSVGQ